MGFGVMGKTRSPAPAVPTLADLAASPGAAWFWVYCGIPCGHSAAIPWQAVIGRLGQAASSNRLRAALRCSRCGKRGATLRLPGCPRWGDLPPMLPIHEVPDWVRAQAEKASENQSVGGGAG
jgi:hypothetical protein